MAKRTCKNIKGVFKVSANLKGKHIPIADDLMTIGASLNELAKTFKNAYSPCRMLDNRKNTSQSLKLGIYV